MIKTSLLAFFAIAAMAQSQIKTGHDIENGSAILACGATLTHKTVIEPPLKNSTFQLMGTGFGTTGNTLHYFIYDKAGQSYFGYDMTVTPAPDAKSFQVAFGPLTVSSVQDALEAVAGDLPLNAAPLPKYPAPQSVESGDTIALDLMTSANGHEKIVVYAQLTEPANAGPPPPAAAAAPRDFSIDDGPVSFPNRALSVKVNGEKLPSPGMTSRGGSTLAFYFPGQGRYVLSLAPHDGFVKSGTVRANVIAFQADGRQYEIQFSSPIAGSEKAWNLYLLHDPGYLPQNGNATDYVQGTIDRLENLLPKRL